MLATAIITFAGAALLIAMAPGPGTALLVRQIIRGGRRLAFATTLGNSSGLLFWSIAAACGLSALIAVSQVAYDTIKITGAIVLIGLGAQSLWQARKLSAAAGETPAITAPSPSQPVHASVWPTYRLGLLTNLMNPKAAIFALSFLPQFVPTHAPVLPTTLLLGLEWAIISTLWYATLAFLISRATSIFSRSRVRQRLEQLSGFVLIGLGVRVAIEQR